MDWPRFFPTAQTKNSTCELTKSILKGPYSQCFEARTTWKPQVLLPRFWMGMRCDGPKAIRLNLDISNVFYLSSFFLTLLKMNELYRRGLTLKGETRNLVEFPRLRNWNHLGCWDPSSTTGAGTLHHHTRWRAWLEDLSSPLHFEASVFIRKSICNWTWMVDMVLLLNTNIILHSLFCRPFRFLHPECMFSIVFHPFHNDFRVT